MPNTEAGYMKISRYTFFISQDDRFYIYNTLSNSLLEVDNIIFHHLIECKNKVCDIDCSNIDQDIFQELHKRLFITDNDDDDFLKYKSIISMQRRNDTVMHLTLAPTMECCFNCHYCFERIKEKGSMKEDIMDSIVDYVCSNPNLKKLRLTWFGGEPLMAAGTMGLFYDKLMTRWKNDFSSNIITTGYHLNERIIKELQRMQVSSMQITLDGVRETHNRIKNNNGNEDVFEKVIQNIEMTNDIAPEIYIVIRVNLTMENSHEYTVLYKYLAKRLSDRRNIAVLPAFVLDKGEKHDKKIFFSHESKSRFILNLWNNYKIDSSYIRYPEPLFNECAIRNTTAIAFDPNGYAYKCWELIGNKSYAIGRLASNGKLTDINEVNLNRQLYGADPLEDPVCSKCNYLPICNGGCPIQRIKNRFEGEHNNCCSYYKGFLEEFIKAHIERKSLTV